MDVVEEDNIQGIFKINLPGLEKSLEKIAQNFSNKRNLLDNQISNLNNQLVKTKLIW